MAPKDTTKAWPGDAPFALCVTHDVDHIRRCLYQTLWRGWREGPRGLSRELQARLACRNPSWNFERLARFEDDLGIRSTFLIMHETARGFGPKYWGRYKVDRPDLTAVLRELDASGWEVGLHGSLESYARPGLLQKEKDILEQQLGKAVVSTRQHYLRLRKGTTLALQEACGLEVDSTLGFSAIPYDGRYGFFPFCPEGRAIVELPVTIMDTVGPEDKQVRARCEALLERVADAGGLVTLDWHQCICNDKLFPERMALLRDALTFARTRGAWIAPMRDIARHWKTLQCPAPEHAGALSPDYS